MSNQSGSIWRCTVADGTVPCVIIQVKRWGNIISVKIIFRSSSPPPAPTPPSIAHDRNIFSSPFMPRDAHLLRPKDEDCVFFRDASTFVPVYTASRPEIPGVLISPQPDLLPDVFCLMVRIFRLILVLLYI